MSANQAETYMSTALELAQRGWGRVSPNPMVGAVIVKDERVVGEGWHLGVGTRHAEVMALEEAGDAARGSTVYCTLEPCAHIGATGPCVSELVDAGVAEVVIATRDPNPLVDGRGIGELREAGIKVTEGVLDGPSRRLNAAFERHIVTGMPFVTLKSAITADGKTSAADGSSKWITGEIARADAMRLRAWSDAVVVGSGTALADDPMLTVRDPELAEARPPLRVLVDSSGRVPAQGNLFSDAAPTLVATTELAPAERVEEWLAAGVEVETLPSQDRRVSVEALMKLLGKRDVQGVLVEGGPTLAWSIARAGLADRVVAYIGPMLTGGVSAPGMLGGEGFNPIGTSLRLEFTEISVCGTDVKVEADVLRDR